MTLAKISPLLLFRSKRNGLPNYSIKNQPSGSESSNLDSDIFKILKLSLTISAY